MTDSHHNPYVNTPAYREGIERANAPIPAVEIDQRIPHDKTATFAAPAYLTADYDPSHRPSAVDRSAAHTPDLEAVALAEALIANGTWKRCPECGNGITTGLRVHATCEQNRKAGVA